MYFASSGVVAASLLVLRSTLSMAAPLSEKAIHELEKRISCHTTEAPINNTCVSCASLHKNATACTRSLCSYGVVNPGPEYQINYGVVNSGRKCAVLNCAVGEIYLTSDGKQCLTCTDPFAETCNSTTTVTCGTNFNLVDGKCVDGNPYGQFQGYGLSKPYLPKQQPFSRFQPDDFDPKTAYASRSRLGLLLASVIYYTGNADGAKIFTGQNGPLDRNLGKTADETAVVLLPGYCSELAKIPFVAANKAACKQVYIGRFRIAT